MGPEATLLSSPIRGQQRLRLRVCCRAVTKNPAEDNSVAEVYFQLGPDSPARRAQVALIEQARPAALSQQSIMQPSTRFQQFAGCVQGSVGFCPSMAPYPQLILTT